MEEEIFETEINPIFEEDNPSSFTEMVEEEIPSAIGPDIVNYFW